MTIAPGHPRQRTLPATRARCDHRSPRESAAARPHPGDGCASCSRPRAPPSRRPARSPLPPTRPSRRTRARARYRVAPPRHAARRLRAAAASAAARAPRHRSAGPPSVRWRPATPGGTTGGWRAAARTAAPPSPSRRARPRRSCVPLFRSLAPRRQKKPAERRCRRRVAALDSCFVQFPARRRHAAATMLSHGTVVVRVIVRTDMSGSIGRAAHRVKCISADLWFRNVHKFDASSAGPPQWMAYTHGHPLVHPPRLPLRIAGAPLPRGAPGFRHGWTVGRPHPVRTAAGRSCS